MLETLPIEAAFEEAPVEPCVHIYLRGKRVKLPGTTGRHVNKEEAVKTMRKSLHPWYAERELGGFGWMSVQYARIRKDVNAQLEELEESGALVYVSVTERPT